MPLEEPGAEVGENVAKVEPILPPSNDDLVKEAIGVPAEEIAPTTQTAAAIPDAFKDAVKEAPPPEAKAAAKIESAAGTTASKAITPGGYYVQLASVKSVSGAAGEYKKMQVKYPSLSSVDFRTQEANLGEKGIFHRIQAGPMSKASATEICMGIKAKGGSCLVAGK